MTIDQLVALTNGLSATAGTQTLMLDRARVRGFKDGSVDISFRVAGTDFAPRLSLPSRRLASSSFEDVVSILRRVVSSAVPHPVI
jgi:hypothetical protein